MYDDVRVAHPEVYASWLSMIRNKVTGRANEALVVRNTNREWNNIRTTLIDVYGDRRDLSTLIQQIPYMRQKNNDVATFYRECSELVQNINQKIALDDRYENHVNAVMLFANDLIKNAFIDGLNDPVSGNVRSYRPESLEAILKAETFRTANLRSSSQNVPNASNAFNVQRPNFSQRNDYGQKQNFAPRINYPAPRQNFIPRSDAPKQNFIPQNDNLVNRQNFGQRFQRNN